MKLLGVIILIVVVNATYSHSQENNASTSSKEDGATQQLIPDGFVFLDSENIDHATFLIEEDIELNQLLITNSITPSKEYNYIEEIKNNKKEDSVVIWSGVLPFITIPNRTDEEEESVFSKDSAAFFFHLKKKF